MRTQILCVEQLRRLPAPGRHEVNGRDFQISGVSPPPTPF